MLFEELQEKENRLTCLKKELKKDYN